MRAMWAITSYYNPMGYKRRLVNYRIFRKNLPLPLVAVELSFDGKFELCEGDADVLVQISDGAIVWQKERLLNLAVGSVPRTAATIAWLDCDIVFERPDWIEAATAQLNKSRVVQLFSEVIDLGSDDDAATATHRKLAPTGRGIVSLVTENKLGPSNIVELIQQVANARSKCVGFALAARREIVESHGLYDAMVIGGGVRALMAALYGQYETLAQTYQLNKARREHYLKWALPYHDAVAESVGYVSGRMFHLWHGDGKNRKYRERHLKFAGFDFDPEADLRIGANGAWQWKRSRPDLNEFFADYFMSRAEDG